MITTSIDLNCDMGEGDSLTDCEHDASIMPFISSCNIACGGHAGSRQVMERVVSSALEHGLKLGAHPSYPDRENFGRQVVAMPVADLLDSLRRQVELLMEVVASLGGQLSHVKPHGALYHQLSNNQALAQAFSEQIAAIDPSLDLFGLAGATHYLPNAQRVIYREGFIDRHYQANGQLVPRSSPNALITDIHHIGARAVDLAKYHRVFTLENHPVTVECDTLCIHGDTPNALAIAQTVYQTLLAHDVEIR